MYSCFQNDKSAQVEIILSSVIIIQIQFAINSLAKIKTLKRPCIVARSFDIVDSIRF